eukprot:3310492-Amphidinium_carterae.1
MKSQGSWLRKAKTFLSSRRHAVLGWSAVAQKAVMGPLALVKLTTLRSFHGRAVNLALVSVQCVV